MSAELRQASKEAAVALRPRSSALRAIHISLLISSLSACTQGAGCSAESDYVFPPKDKVQSAVQLRVTEPGFEFMGAQVTPLIRDSLPEELNTCLPGDEGTASFIDWRYCNQEVCSNGDIGCDIAIGIGEVGLSAIEPSQGVERRGHPQ